MNDLIYRGTAIIAVKCGSLNARTVYGRTDEGMAVLKETLTAIKELPAVDAVEVVRCKDCKYSHMTFDGECKYCDIWFPDEKAYMDGNYFCARICQPQNAKGIG